MKSLFVVAATLAISGFFVPQFEANTGSNSAGALMSNSPVTAQQVNRLDNNNNSNDNDDDDDDDDDDDAQPNAAVEATVPSVIATLLNGGNDSAAASTPAQRRIIMEAASHADGNVWHHAGWSSKGEADDDQLISLTFAVTQQNHDRLEELFHQITNPQHESYGRHMSWEEVNRVTQPHDDAVSTIREWLLQPEHELDESQIELGAAGDNIVVTRVPVGAVERMLGCQLHDFEHANGETAVRSIDGYSLPDNVAPYVDFVGGIGRLHKSQLRAAAYDTSAEAAVGGVKVTPQVLRQLYSIPESAVGTNTSNSQSVVEFLGQYFDPKDLSLYLSKHHVPEQKVSRIIGDNDVKKPGSEATLDVEAIMGVAPGVPTEVWSFSGLRDNKANASYWNQEPFLNWMLTIANSDSVPLVHSVSYDDDEYTLSHSYINRLNAEFRKAALRGITLLFASGDDGIGGINVREHGSENCTAAVPAFPAASPYITSIGATMLDQSGKQEIVCSSSEGSGITTGGGFSNLFTAPSYQTKHINKYVTQNEGKHMPPAGYFNGKGRVFPDLALIGNNYEYVIRQQTRYISGTSASTPVFAGMIALLNDARLNKGLPPLGFLNYWLYQMADEFGWDAPDSVFNDVTVGDNACSAKADNCCEFGFQATKGFDAASGLGTPNFMQMLKHI